MDILIVYGSQYGNTQRIAQAIAATLSSEHAVRTVQASVASDVTGDEVDMLFVERSHADARPSASGDTVPRWIGGTRLQGNAGRGVRHSSRPGRRRSSRTSSRADWRTPAVVSWGRHRASWCSASKGHSLRVRRPGQRLGPKPSHGG